MLVDDEPEFVNLVKFFLEKDFSMSVDPAHTVKEALAVLDKGEHDAIISDYQMPEMDGLDFLKIVRAKGEDLPFILLTGRGREDVAVEALNLGADFYIQKHGDMKSMYAELANAVRQSVEKRAAVESLRASERTYRQLIELAQEGIWVVDRDGITTLVNPKMAEMLGRSKEEMLGRPFFEFMAESERSKAAEKLRARIEGKSEEHEFEFIRSDGSVMHAFLGTCPVYDEHNVVSGALAVVTDISLRVSAEKALRKERDAAQNYLDVAGVMLICIDTKGIVTLINRRGCEILGCSEDEILGRNWFDNFLPERERERILGVHRGVLDERMTIKDVVANAVLTKSGEERLIRWRNVSLKDDEGNVTHTLSSGEDITEARMYESRLQRKLEETEAIATLSTMLISPTLSVAELAKMVLNSALSLTDSEHGFVSSVDPVSKSVVSHTLTEMVTGGSCGVRGFGESTPVFPIGPDGSYPSLWGVPLNTRTPFFTNAPGEHEKSTGVPEGHVPVVNFLSSPVLYGDELVGQVSIANSCRDYDEDDLRIICRLADIFAVALQRERDLANLVMAQSRFRAFMEHVPAVTYMKGLDGRYVFVNRKYEELLGTTEGEIVGRTDADLWPEPTAEQFGRNDRNVLSSGQSGRFIEFVPVGAETREYLSFKFPVLDSQGKPTILGGVSADITDMRDVETALKHANEKLRMLSQITSHDALNQASVMRGWISIAKQEAGSGEISDHLAKTDAALSTLTRLLEFAGEYEQIGSDRPQWVNIQEVCEAVWSELHVKDVKFDCRCHGMEILADPMFPRVIGNLVDNTLRHSGGATRIEVLCEPTDDGVLLVYQDNGSGIPSVDKARIFDKGVGSNTGLGLYMVRELLMISEMKIVETGTPGEGARFEITIPSRRLRAEKT